MKFQRGEPRPPNAGRRAGTPNKSTAEVRAVLLAAVRDIGGEQRLVDWIKESPQNEFAFWTVMVPRLLPLNVRGTGPRGELEVNLNPEELAKRMEERGLPTTIFGLDAPDADGTKH